MIQAFEITFTAHGPKTVSLTAQTMTVFASTRPEALKALPALAGMAPEVIYQAHAIRQLSGTEVQERF